MTFDQLFSGRMLLMRAQRHVAQSGVRRYRVIDDWLTPEFVDTAAEQAFFIIEFRLVELEKLFEAKKSRRDAKSRRHLTRRMDAQVTSGSKRA